MAALSPSAPSRRSRRKSDRRIVEEKQLTLPGTDLDFLFQRDGCRSLRMTVKADGSVRVRAPAGLPMSRVFSFMRARLTWIQEKRTFFAAHRGPCVPARDGATALYLTRPFTIRPVPAPKNAMARLVGHVLELPCRCRGGDAEADAKALERAFRRWQKNMAHLVLGRRLSRMDRLARSVFNDDRHVSSLVVRSLKRRWGSCSARGEITLAVQLIAMPLPLIDYVLCHELCHLRVMNHGPRFHALLHTLLPDAKKREQLIHIWGLEHPR